MEDASIINAGAVGTSLPPGASNVNPFGEDSSEETTSSSWSSPSSRKNKMKSL